MSGSTRRFYSALKLNRNPQFLQEFLDAIEKLQGQATIQPYVFTRHLKVAASGLERRYRECRERGTLFFKFDACRSVFREPPRWTGNDLHRPPAASGDGT